LLQASKIPPFDGAGLPAQIRIASTVQVNGDPTPIELKRIGVIG